MSVSPPSSDFEQLRRALAGDGETTVQSLRDVVEAFVAERDWHRFHTPKNLSMALAIEAAELMEHFQWLEPQESCDIGASPKSRRAVGEELADVICYALALANALQIDVSSAVAEKMEANARRYPAGNPPPRDGGNREGSSVEEAGLNRATGGGSESPG